MKFEKIRIFKLPKRLNMGQKNHTRFLSSDNHKNPEKKEGDKKEGDLPIPN